MPERMGLMFMFFVVTTVVRCQSDYDSPKLQYDDDYSEKDEELVVQEDESDDINDYDSDIPEITSTSMSKPVTTKPYRRSGFWRRPIITTDEYLNTVTKVHRSHEDVTTTEKTTTAQTSPLKTVAVSERNFKDTGFWRRIKNKISLRNATIATTVEKHKSAITKGSHAPKITTFKWSPKHRHTTELTTITEQTTRRRETHKPHTTDYKFDRKSQLEASKKKKVTNKSSVKDIREEAPKIYKIINKVAHSTNKGTPERAHGNRHNKITPSQSTSQKDEDMFYDVKVLLRVRNKIKPMRKRSQGTTRRRRPIKPRGVIKELWGKGRQLLAGTTTTLRSTLEGIEIDLAEQWIKFVNTYDTESYGPRAVEASYNVVLLSTSITFIANNRR